MNPTEPLWKTIVATAEKHAQDAGDHLDELIKTNTPAGGTFDLRAIDLPKRLELIQQTTLEAAQGTAAHELVTEVFDGEGVPDFPLVDDQHTCAALRGMIEGLRLSANAYEALLPVQVLDGSPVCPGHNPDLLTVDQVGSAEVWRLLEPSEIRERDHDGDIELWILGEGWTGGGWRGNSRFSTYRTARPVGHFLTH